MNDVFTIVQGNLYDPGQAYDYWYMVISDNSYNKDNNTIICCFVKLFDSSKDLNNTDIVFEYNGIKYKIITDSITNHYSKKLCRYQYKGTLSGDIIEKVLDKIKFMLGFTNLFTLNEAKDILAEKEIELKAKYGAYGIPKTEKEPEKPLIDFLKPAVVTIPPANTSNIKLSRDDEQKAFAREMANLSTLVEEPPKETPAKKVIKTKSKEKSEKKKVIKRRKKNDLVYNNIEDFLFDYMSYDTAYVLKKYKISDKGTMNKLFHNIKMNYPDVFESVQNIGG